MGGEGTMQIHYILWGGQNGKRLYTTSVTLRGEERDSKVVKRKKTEERRGEFKGGPGLLYVGKEIRFQTGHSKEI